MAYLGNRPAESYASFERQVFTIVNSQTAYTLSHSVTNENDIRLVVNNVVQEPGSGKAYTASGTTLTLSAALVNGTDEMYCVFLGRALQTVNPPNASVGSAQIADSLISGKTALGATPADTDELLISDAGTLKRVDYSYLKSANTPSFSARLNADQTLSDNSYTKIVFNTEVYDTDSGYDTSTGRYTIPSGKGGKYSISYQLLLYDANGQLTGGRASLYKNGSSLEEQILDMEGGGDKYFYNSTMGTNIILDLSASDYIEVYGRGNTLDSGTFVIDGDTNAFYSFFQAYKLIGV